MARGPEAILGIFCLLLLFSGTYGAWRAQAAASATRHALAAAVREAVTEPRTPASSGGTGVGALERWRRGLRLEVRTAVDGDGIALACTVSGTGATDEWEENFVLAHLQDNLLLLADP